MTLIRGAIAVVVRVAAVTVFYLLFLAVLSGSESTDPLGAGLLFFLILVIVAGVWAGIDAISHGFVAAVLVWACTAVLGGAALGVGHLLTDDGVSMSEALRDDLPFFALLLFVPAAVAALLGGLVHRARRPSPSGPATVAPDTRG